MRNIEDVERQTIEFNVSEVDCDTLGSDDNVQSDSDIFRRILTESQYDLTRRVEVLERHSGNPFSVLSTAWSYTVPVLIFLMLLVGGMRYFGYRVDNTEKLQREEILALRNEFESKQLVIDRLPQTIRQQARSQRATAAVPTLAIEESVTVGMGEALAVPKSALASQRPPRAQLPASLELGQVLLIVASTLSKEEALDLALLLELDGHASEVVRGMTGYYGVALGRFDFDVAKSTRSFLVETGVVTSMPYFMTDGLIDSYVYP
jgi:hypothetical protein